MSFIGNDIVDLVNNQPHPRFLDRITSSREKERFTHLSTEEVWKLWACKEASYKCFMQLLGSIEGIPRRFEISQDFRSCEFKGQRLCLAVEQSDDFVYVMANPDLQAKPTYRIARTIEDESKEVRNLLQEMMPSPGEVKKSPDGVPSFISEGKAYPISLTHHKRFYRRLHHNLDLCRISLLDIGAVFFTDTKA